MLHEEVNYLLGLSCMSSIYKLVMKALIFSHSDVDRSMHLEQLKLMCFVSTVAGGSWVNVAGLFL
jgi:hypothetical protein